MDNDKYIYDEVGNADDIVGCVGDDTDGRDAENDDYDNGCGDSDDCNDGGSIGVMVMTLMMIM